VEANDIEFRGKDRERIYRLVPQVLHECKRVTEDREIDFNDMIWLPVVNDLSCVKAGLLIVDEGQDLNKCQQALALKLGKRIGLIGDPKQAIYGFAGADCNSINNMFETLNGLPEQCERLFLTVTRRCGKAIVEEAKKLVPDFEAHETNSPGEVRILRYDRMKPDFGYLSQVKDGDMILCRMNAPLISQCFALIKLGVKARIIGRDIGAGLRRIVKKLNPSSIEDFIVKVEEYSQKELARERNKTFPSEAKEILITDRRDMLITIAEECEVVDGIFDKIDALFSDSEGGVRLSSIHKSKGLESPVVWFLKPEGADCPHPMAKGQEQLEQEYNLKYVAITRAIQQLNYVI
jgi:superfamily I DNA/RNA helicase